MAKQTINYISVFVTVILALAFVVAIASLTQERTSQTIVANELVNLAPARLAGGAINTTYPFTVTNYPTGWKTETRDCDISGVVFGNASTDFTLTTDYTFTATTGVLLLKDTATVANNTAGNTTYIDYSYCPNDYVNSSWARTILNTNVGIYAIAILIVVIVLVYLLLGKEGRDD